MTKIKEASKFNYEMVIKENHLDSFGHVNNAVYMQIFEEARWEFITINGYGLNEIHKLKKGPIVLEANLKFIKEIKLREKINIETICTDAKSKILNLTQKIINSKSEICTEANFVLAFFDLEARKILNPTPEWLHAVGVKFE